MEMSPSTPPSFAQGSGRESPYKKPMHERSQIMTKALPIMSDRGTVPQSGYRTSCRGYRP